MTPPPMATQAHVAGVLVALPPEEAGDLVALVRRGGVVSGEVAEDLVGAPDVAVVLQAYTICGIWS